MEIYLITFLVVILLLILLEICVSKKDKNGLPKYTKDETQTEIKQQRKDEYGFFDFLFNNVEYTKRECGRIGETIVNELLEEICDKGKVLNNLYIPSAKGGTVEIDNLFITKSSIFVIESKNISGDIYGEENNKIWISEREDRTIEFRNPILQNKTHIKYLKKQLKYLIPIYSIIVFNDEADLSNIVILDTHIKIIHYHELVDTIKQELIDEESFINENQLENLYNALVKYTNVSDEVIRKHNEYIMETYR